MRPYEPSSIILANGICKDSARCRWPCLHEGVILSHACNSLDGNATTGNFKCPAAAFLLRCHQNQADLQGFQPKCGWLEASTARLVPMCRAYLSQTDSQSKQMQNLDPYDQYEVSVPLSVAGDCLQMVGPLHHSQLTTRSRQV